MILLSDIFLIIGNLGLHLVCLFLFLGMVYGVVWNLVDIIKDNRKKK